MIWGHGGDGGWGRGGGCIKGNLLCQVLVHKSEKLLPGEWFYLLSWWSRGKYYKYGVHDKKDYQCMWLTNGAFCHTSPLATLEPKYVAKYMSEYLKDFSDWVPITHKNKHIFYYTPLWDLAMQMVSVLSADVLRYPSLRFLPTQKYNGSKLSWIWEDQRPEKWYNQQ